LKALLSVYDKTSLADFARALHKAGCSLISTGGTYATLTQAGLPVQQVSDVTGFPEILDGRVKTLHPKIHGGILARRDIPEHMSQLSQQAIEPIDILVSNLYPFVQTVSKPNVTLEDALENIDIGGPAMVRAAAKNFPHVTVIVDPNDYTWVTDRLENGGPSLDERQRLAQKAFAHVSQYDDAVASYLARSGDGLPSNLSLAYAKLSDLRYGENPHQQGALYRPAHGVGGFANAQVLHGKEPSFNNILDADAAWRVVSDFSDQAVVVIKHTNPCGLAVHDDQAEAYRRAYEGDTTSAFGGIVGFNRPVTNAAVEAMKGVFYEVVVAPGYEPDALEILKKRKNLRILQISPVSGPPSYDLRPVTGALLVQTPDASSDDPSSWQVVTSRKPTDREMADLAFAWTACKHVKSNAIVLTRDQSLAGMGAGQPNRVTSVHLALRSAGDKAKGSVLASDAFFPFPDNVDLAAQGGITAIVQPGGSIRDNESIEAANRQNIAMIFTGRRHFKH
jgi:phosphoribosylaminoimidazolecarboxamide formyltransferase/IMP cyclohydrolase